MTRPPAGWRAVVATAVCAVALAGCSSDGDERTDAAAGSTPVTPTSTASTAGTASTATSGAPREPGCSIDGVESRTDVPYLDLSTVPGVDPSSVSLDVSFPVPSGDCEPAPIVVFVHGGGFVVGDKANTSPDKAALFNDAGWVFATINYRLAPNPPAPGVQHPTQVGDVAAAVAWLRDNAADLHADPDRIALMGHSSGAFLVALVGTDPSLLDSVGASFDALRCVVSLDTEGFDIAAQVATGGRREAMFRNAFGDDPAVWDAASPQRLVAGSAPGARLPAFLLVSRGNDRRSAQNGEFAAALAAVGATVDVVDAEPLDHAGVNRAVGEPGDTIVTPPLMEFFRSCLAM